MTPPADPSPLPADPLFEAAPVALLLVAAGGSVRRLNAAARRLVGSALQPGQAVPSLATLPSGSAAPAAVLLPGLAALEATASAAGDAWVVALQPAVPSSSHSAELSLALELGQIAVWRVDIERQRVHPSANAWQLLGLAARAEGLSVDEMRELTHPDDLGRVSAGTAALLAGGPPAMTEARFRRADGAWRHVLMHRTLQAASGGAGPQLIGVGMDITERIQQQQRADDMTRRFELVTRTGGIGYWLFEHGAGRAVWSEQLHEIFGLPVNQPVPVFDDWLARCVHPADREALRRAFADWVMAGHAPAAHAFRALRPDGSVRHVVAHSRVEHADGGSAGPLLFGVVIDATERRLAEQALRSAAERVALATRSAGLGTWELDLQTGQAHWDAQMWLLRGLPPEPRAMTRSERMACVHPEDAEWVQRLFDVPLPTGGPREYEFRIVMPDGQVRWLASRSLELTDDVSGVRKRIGVNWDVTDTRDADAARREREVAQRESLAKSKFLARMSHELRTPLNAVLGFSQLLLADEHGTDTGSAARRRKLEHVRAAGQHLLTLIDGVLDLSSLEGGELHIALQPVALAPLVRETLPLLKPLLGAGGAPPRVSVVAGRLDGSVMADATRLRQVLLNLLSNAVKYNREGGEVRIEALPRGEWLLLRVADTGRGMNDEQLRHLFEPFNRLGVPKEGSGAIDGTGIGLAIVKALVEHMGGSVHVDSTAGAGSVFELRLKAVDPAALREGSAPAAAARPAQGGTNAPPAARQRSLVLYIEDNPVNALIIAELMARRSDLALQVAVDGLGGVAQARALLPELVLLDMQLPDIDGFEVLRRLRAEPATAHIPVIALSANAMPNDIERALAAGMSDYWTKPLDFKAFLRSLDELFGKAPA